MSLVPRLLVVIAVAIALGLLLGGWVLPALGVTGLAAPVALGAVSGIVCVLLWSRLA